MAGRSPYETFHDIHAAMEARDMAAVMGCFVDEAVFLPPGGEEVRGREAVGRAMAEFFETEPKLQSHLKRCVVVGDVALLMNEWSLEAEGTDGEGFTAAGTSADVLHRGSDGEWRYVIDNPSGTS